MESKFKSPLHKTVSTTKTDFWNDSCSIEELTYAIEHGAVGATSNPTIVLNVFKQEFHLWKERLLQIIRENPTWSEVEVTWKIFEEIGVKGVGKCRYCPGTELVFAQKQVNSGDEPMKVYVRCVTCGQHWKQG